MIRELQNRCRHWVWTPATTRHRYRDPHRTVPAVWQRASDTAFTISTKQTELNQASFSQGATTAREGEPRAVDREGFLRRVSLFEQRRSNVVSSLFLPPFLYCHWKIHFLRGLSRWPVGVTAFCCDLGRRRLAQTEFPINNNYCARTMHRNDLHEGMFWPGIMHD